MGSRARIGFVGLGTMGRDLLRETVKNPKAEIGALCDLDADALAQAVAITAERPREGAAVAGDGPAQYTDYRAMLREVELDGVVVAVPQDLHERISVDALDAGCHTFCEKPMALSVAQCESMIAASQRNAKGLMIGQVLRYIGVYRYVLELAQSGTLGTPVAVRIIRTMGKWGSWARPWRLKRATSGGLLFEVNVHEIDFMRCVLGEAASVSAVGKRFVNEETDYEDFVTAHLSFANGGIGSLASARCDYLGQYAGEVYCEHGTIYYDSLSQLTRVAKDGEDKREIPYGEMPEEWENGVYREMREFIESCLGESPVTIPGEEGMRNVEIAEACYLSIAEGRPVTLPLPRG